MDQYTCPTCFSQVLRTKQALHDNWHTTPARLPFDIPDTATIQTRAQYGIEFHDELADNETFESLREAKETMEDYAEAKDDLDTEGMRLMSRTVTTIFGPWIAFKRP